MCVTIVYCIIMKDKRPVHWLEGDVARKAGNKGGQRQMNEHKTEWSGGKTAKPSRVVDDGL